MAHLIFEESDVNFFDLAEYRRLLKAPRLIPWTYISQYYNINTTEGSQYVQKYVQKSSEEVKRWTMLSMSDKKGRQ